MKISARVENAEQRHHVTVRTNDQARELSIPPKAEGFGSSANGGELLCLALATCYCNDIYREARKRGIEVRSVEVEVESTFGGEGEPAREIAYRATVSARATREEIEALMRHTDTVAEVQNTLRQTSPVRLAEVRAREV